jgi:hypothetical protein
VVPGVDGRLLLSYFNVLTLIKRILVTRCFLHATFADLTDAAFDPQLWHAGSAACWNFCSFR